MAGNSKLSNDQMGSEERLFICTRKVEEKGKGWKGFTDNLMQIVKVVPLAGTNVALRGVRGRRAGRV